MNSKEKLAVCIPSYNECKNITNITQKIDRYLNKYRSRFNIYLVNADNNSQDGTNKIFNATATKSNKFSLITSDKGKGNNLLAFFKWCEQEDIDYCITIDADVISIKQMWIDKFIHSLVDEKSDYVVPIYKRSRYEGSTTVHFAMPIVYSTTGYYIRQPIAGDFAFDKKFIKIINKQPINKAIMQYGIDIFMTLTACYNNLKVSQIELGRKIHNPSYNKMENMFLEVLDAAVFTINKNGNHVSKVKGKIIENNSFLSTRKFNHKNRAIELNEQYKIDNVDISEEWVNCMQELLKSIKDANHIDYSDIQKKFIYRATTFWLNAEKISSNECERLIINQTRNIDRGVRGR